MARPLLSVNSTSPSSSMSSSFLPGSNLYTCNGKIPGLRVLWRVVQATMAVDHRWRTNHSFHQSGPRRSLARELVLLKATVPASHLGHALLLARVALCGHHSRLGHDQAPDVVILHDHQWTRSRVLQVNRAVHPLRLLLGIFDLGHSLQY